MHLGNIMQNNNLISGRFKPCVGMMFASAEITISLGLSAQENTLPRPDDVTVFGSAGRPATLHSFSSNLLEHVQQSVNQEPLNVLDQITPAVSHVATGEVGIEDERPTGIYQKYNGFSDLISMEIIADALIIQSMIVKSGSLVS
jgi:hypothetical protein